MTQPQTPDIPSAAANSVGHVALVVTAAPLARHTRDAYDLLREAGWTVTICPTADAHGWIVDPPLSQDFLSGRIRPDAVICCPATFNTLNKWAAGINDSPPLGVLNDAIGLGTPLLAVPMIGERLGRHPVWPATLTFLTAARVDLLDPVTGQPTRTPSCIVSGTGDDVADQFDHQVLLHWLTQATRQARRTD
ncbi:flavoprotein [Microlunatus ginsengisoli]|uniref:Flavoprotein domain-containing protein n=1 Tax=Microlunatus ginsengisoli TaxID=363863 RepID=A0ABP6ZLF7_9ACTN